MQITWGPWLKDGATRSCEGQDGDVVVSVTERADGVVLCESFSLGSDVPISEGRKLRYEAEAKAHASAVVDKDDSGVENSASRRTFSETY